MDRDMGGARTMSPDNSKYLDELVKDDSPRFNHELAGAALRHRRVQLWAVAVVAIVGLLGVQMCWPNMPLLSGLHIDIPAGQILLLFLVAMACEFIDSSLGMGYGTTLTPLLMLAGFAPAQVVPAVLLSECCTGITAGLLHHRDGNVDFLRDRTARGTTILLLVLTVMGVLTAVFVAGRISKFWLSATIAAIVLAVGVLILLTANRQLRLRRGHLLVVGAVAAFNKGISGGGYGPLVTSGQIVCGLPAKQAIGITSLAEGLTCLVGVAAYLMVGRPMDWSLAGPMTAGAMLSVPVATLVVRQMPETLMRCTVGLVTCLLGAIALAKVLQ
jgi:uncharacterized membrane protein YfcA